MKVKFTKMHGCGNDYIYINCFNQFIDNPVLLSEVLCDRRRSIGGDGIILIEPSNVAEAKMRIFNKDGSEGKMCGNGIRCVAKYLIDEKISNESKPLRIDTLSGIKILRILENHGNTASIEVNMGKASLDPVDIPMLVSKEKVVNESISVGGEVYKMTCVSMGNPHCVVFVDEAYSANVKEIGPQLSTHTMFPEGVNVEFVSLVDENNLMMRVWERGSGETLACGSGACASVVAASENGFCKCGNEVTVHLRGGELKVRYYQNEVFLKGDAVRVFEGEISI